MTGEDSMAAQFLNPSTIALFSFKKFYKIETVILLLYLINIVPS